MMLRTVAVAILALSLAKPVLAQAQDLANKTWVTFSSGHGTQVSYTRGDGAGFLWYPGNRVVLPGRWAVRSGQICFLYGPNTYNPVTGERGAQWSCRPAAVRDRSVVDRASGDVFGLSRRSAPPFVLTPERTTIAALRSRMQH